MCSSLVQYQLKRAEGLLTDTLLPLNIYSYCGAILLETEWFQTDLLIISNLHIKYHIIHLKLSSLFIVSNLHKYHIIHLKL